MPIAELYILWVLSNAITDFFYIYTIYPKVQSHFVEGEVRGQELNYGVDGLWDLSYKSIENKIKTYGPLLDHLILAKI